MTFWVIDASVIGPLLIADEEGGLHAGLQNCLLSGRAVVPQHWRLEVVNFGLMAVRRKRLSFEHLMFGLATLADAPPVEDRETGANAWAQTVALARDRQLTIYDAAYIELAKRRRLPLLTTDGDLRRAAAIEQVDLVAD